MARSSLAVWAMAGAMLATAVSTGTAGDWPQFRGPQGSGVAAEGNYPTSWAPDENIKWKVDLPGDGNGSPIVSAGQVFVTTADASGQKRRLHSFDRTSGKELWTRTIEVEQVEETHKTNPYAGTTPASDGQSVVVWHGSPGLFCYDMKGEELWRRDLGTVGHIWGYGSSPIIHDGKVVLNFGPGEETFMVALDLKTGDQLWKTEEPGGANSRNPRMVGSWSTPLVANVDGKDQIINSMPKRVVSYDADNGDILWTIGGLPSPRGDLVYPSVILSGDIGVAMGGYKGPAMAFTLGGSGDVTEKNRIWYEAERQPQRIGSGVIIGDHIYIANAGPGTAQCIELKTGKTLWEKRISGGHWGSLVLAGGNLYATAQNGSTVVFKPNPEKFEEVSKNALGESSNATPAFSDGEIFLRTSKSLFAIGAK